MGGPTLHDAASKVTRLALRAPYGRRGVGAGCLGPFVRSVLGHLGALGAACLGGVSSRALAGVAGSACGLRAASSGLGVLVAWGQWAMGAMRQSWARCVGRLAVSCHLVHCALRGLGSSALAACWAHADSALSWCWDGGLARAASGSSACAPRSGSSSRGVRGDVAAGVDAWRLGASSASRAQDGGSGGGTAALGSRVIGSLGTQRPSCAGHPLLRDSRAGSAGSCAMAVASSSSPSSGLGALGAAAS
jgi:hypothetical protein